MQRLDDHILDDADLAGPLVFCLLLGSCLLLAGKVLITAELHGVTVTQ